MLLQENEKILTAVPRPQQGAWKIMTAFCGWPGPTLADAGRNYSPSSSAAGDECMRRVEDIRSELTDDRHIIFSL